MRSLPRQTRIPRAASAPVITSPPAITGRNRATTQQASAPSGWENTHGALVHANQTVKKGAGAPAVRNSRATVRVRVFDTHPIFAFVRALVLQSHNESACRGAGAGPADARSRRVEDRALWTLLT